MTLSGKQHALFKNVRNDHANSRKDGDNLEFKSIIRSLEKFLCHHVKETMVKCARKRRFGTSTMNYGISSVYLQSQYQTTSWKNLWCSRNALSQQFHFLFQSVLMCNKQRRSRQIRHSKMKQTNKTTRTGKYPIVKKRFAHPTYRVFIRKELWTKMSHQHTKK